MTEHDKYAKGATKPGGFAQNGYFNEGAGAGTTGSAGGEVVGDEYLSSRAPWVCSVCNVTCTSRQTLESHATGTKHVRRVRARQKTENGDALPSKGDVIDTPVQSSDTKEESSKKKKKDKKEKSKDSSVKSELKKLVKKELKKNDGSMKKKKLLAALDSFLKEHKYSEEKFEKKLLKSGDFEVDGKVIKLKS